MEENYVFHQSHTLVCKVKVSPVDTIQQFGNQILEPNNG